ncbi:tetratricopeptide repeat protein [Engelhardtia mirabilis]|uniref:Tetratricopeptide repeat protein n=1 Tax=Engelhardtia mirabilis TaxID=2528011 RepID=A0A518BPJ7_9BACT|nr:Tetratricopeptide repeat protein [Planctomycetes bacterium Pla133]QDV03190.1 Tetratricopeptide repeat protein [Planctomycetes bacterium Pla86]
MTPRSERTRLPSHGYPRLAVLLLAALVAACSSPRLSPWIEQPGPYDRLSPGQDERLSVARALLDQRDAVGAARVLETAQRRDPLHAGIAVCLQDARLAAVLRGDQLQELEAWREANRSQEQDAPDELLWRWYDAIARERAEVVDRLLAARLDPDARASLRQLEVLSLDEPGCIWAHLGRAHTLLKLGRLSEARRALDTALELDPGHARTRRLEALVLAREGKDELAVEALERWLEKTADDPLVGATARDRAELDLAAALLEAERYKAARKRLDRLIGDPHFDDLDVEPRYQAFVLRAAAREGRGDFSGARDDADRARVEAPTRLLPWVQIAILEEYRLGNPDAAAVAWRRVEELAVDAPDADRIGAFLYGQRARVERARLEASMGELEVQP